MKMKWLRRWSRILHRDIGYFFIGASLIYGISGIALNHINDWNPSYSVDLNHFNTTLALGNNAQEDVINQLIDDQGRGLGYKSHYYPEKGLLKVFMKGGSTLLVDTSSGMGTAEFLNRRAVFYEVNYLHYNPNAWWMWFSDIFAGALIFLAITSFFIVKGKNGAWGRGGVYIALGIIIPIVFLIVFG
jgi:hypothetical protein